MKTNKILLLIAAVVLLCSCSGRGTKVQVTGARDEFVVEKLFVADSIVVYRFIDRGVRVYFTNKISNIKAYRSEYNAATKTSDTKVVQTSCSGE